MKRNVAVIPKAVQSQHHMDNYGAQQCREKLTAEDHAKIWIFPKPELLGLWLDLVQGCNTNASRVLLGEFRLFAGISPNQDSCSGM
jgi:hypothetical protein